MISEKTKQKWNIRIDYCVEHQDELNDWELGFIESICLKDKDLTIRESFKLGEIFHKLEEG